MDNVKPCWKSWINLVKENFALGEIRLGAHRVQDTSKGKMACGNGFLRSQDMTGHLRHHADNCSQRRGDLPGKGPSTHLATFSAMCCIRTVILGSQASVPLFQGSLVKEHVVKRLLPQACTQRDGRPLGSCCSQQFCVCMDGRAAHSPGSLCILCLH